LLVVLLFRGAQEYLDKREPDRYFAAAVAAAAAGWLVTFPRATTMTKLTLTALATLAL
jgi:hypothetical protein